MIGVSIPMRTAWLQSFVASGIKAVAVDSTIVMPTLLMVNISSLTAALKSGPVTPANITVVDALLSHDPLTLPSVTGQYDHVVYYVNSSGLIGYMADNLPTVNPSTTGGAIFRL